MHFGQLGPYRTLQINSTLDSGFDGIQGRREGRNDTSRNESRYDVVIEQLGFARLKGTIFAPRHHVPDLFDRKPKQARIDCIPRQGPLEAVAGLLDGVVLGGVDEPHPKGLDRDEDGRNE